MSPRVELAHSVLKALSQGHRISMLDAFQLRNWALRPEDSTLPLAEIAIRILDHDEGGTSEEPETSR